MLTSVVFNLFLFKMWGEEGGRHYKRSLACYVNWKIVSRISPGLGGHLTLHFSQNSEQQYWPGALNYGGCLVRLCSNTFKLGLCQFSFKKQWIRFQISVLGHIKINGSLEFLEFWSMFCIGVKFNTSLPSSNWNRDNTEVVSTWTSRFLF